MRFVETLKSCPSSIIVRYFLEILFPKHKLSLKVTSNDTQIPLAGMFAQRW